MKPADKPCQHAWSWLKNRFIDSHSKPQEPGYTLRIYQCTRCAKMKTEKA